MPKVSLGHMPERSMVLGLHGRPWFRANAAGLGGWPIGQVQFGHQIRQTQALRSNSLMAAEAGWQPTQAASCCPLCPVKPPQGRKLTPCCVTLPHSPHLGAGWHPRSP